MLYFAYLDTTADTTGRACSNPVRDVTPPVGGRCNGSTVIAIGSEDQIRNIVDAINATLPPVPGLFD